MNLSHEEAKCAMMYCFSFLSHVNLKMVRCLFQTFLVPKLSALFTEQPSKNSCKEAG